MARVPKTLPSEWSFPVEAEKISDKPYVVSIKPTADEKKRLAQRLNIKSLESLSAEITFNRQPGKMSVHAAGAFEAEVKQDCVVSGKPVITQINEKFDAWFADKSKTVPFARARQDKMMEKGNLEMPILDEAEDPEPIVDGIIDAGELVTQFLSLSINPYPHAEGVHYEHGDESEKGPSLKLDNPFAALKDWKGGKKT